LIASLNESERNKFFNSLTNKEVQQLEYDWDFWARPKQKIPQTDWSTWLILTGRGWGKTRTGAETVRQWVEEGVKRLALVAETPADARDAMIEGESGILNVFPPHEKPIYESSKRRVTFHTGATAIIYSGANPDQLRGPQHEKAWCDELAAWDYPDETWSNLDMGLRLGRHPQTIVTTTPRPIKLIKQLINDDSVYVTKGTTYDNKANLSKRFFDTVRKRYEDTRLGRQELYAEILTDTPGSLWTYDMFIYITDKNKAQNIASTLTTIAVAIDPAVTANSESDETGIIVVGKDDQGFGYVLDDFSCRKSPNEWANIAIRAYHKYQADFVVAEVNQGGDMIESILNSQFNNIPYRQVRATRGKQIRAQPISMLYEQGKIIHKKPFTTLEDQLCSWAPEDKNSPDRLDALVWGFTELMLNEHKPIQISRV